MSFKDWWERTFKGRLDFDMPPLTPWQVKAEADQKIQGILVRLTDLEKKHEELIGGGSGSSGADRGTESADSGSSGISAERPDGQVG